MASIIETDEYLSFECILSEIGLIKKARMAPRITIFNTGIVTHNDNANNTMIDNIGAVM